MPCYAQRIIDAAVDSHFVEREALGVVNPSELMWDVLLRTAQIFCNDNVYHEMMKVREEGDFFEVPDNSELLKSIERYLMSEESFMRRVSPEFQDDPIRYISMGWSTGGEMNTFRDDDIHTLINYLPVSAQRFCYREYESQCEQEEEDADSDYDQEEGLAALAGARTVTAEPEEDIADAPTDEEDNSRRRVSFDEEDSSDEGDVNESDYDSMPELEGNDDEEFNPLAPNMAQWHPWIHGPMITYEICDPMYERNSIQV